MGEEVERDTTFDNLYEGVAPFIWRGRNRVIAQTMSTVEEYIDTDADAHRVIRASLMDATEAQMYEMQVKYNAILERANGDTDKPEDAGT